MRVNVTAQLRPGRFGRECTFNYGMRDKRTPTNAKFLFALPAVRHRTRTTTLSE